MDGKFEVLRGLKNVLKIVELYPANWTSSQVRILVPIMLRVCISSSIIFITMAIWMCAENNWDMKIIAAPLCCALGVTQITVIYFDISLSKSIVTEITDSLQKLVQQRE